MYCYLYITLLVIFMDKLRAITVFREVVEQGSFKAAAEKMSLSKSAVSKNIKELESYLKTPLINRTTRLMHLTDSGQFYYNSVCDILNELAAAELLLLDTSNRLRGTLKISMPMSLGSLQINATICKFMTLYPEISIEVVMSNDYVNLLDHGFDIAIRGGDELKDSTLRSRHLMKLNRVLCATAQYIESQDSIKTPNDLIKHNCLTSQLSKSSRQWLFSRVDVDETITIDLSPSNYTVNNNMAIKQAVLADLGIMLIYKRFVLNELNSGELIELLPQWQAEAHDLYAVYPYHKEQSYKLRVFIDFLIKHLKG